MLVCLFGHVCMLFSRSVCFVSRKVCVIRERPRHTAARECDEETLGVVGREKELYQRLGEYKRNHVFKVSSNTFKYTR